MVSIIANHNDGRDHIERYSEILLVSYNAVVASFIIHPCIHLIIYSRNYVLYFVQSEHH